MGKPSRATQDKRQRERSKQERQQEKRDERAKRKEENGKEDGEIDSAGLHDDPDLAGIIPGPQPPLEY